jgi:hypothetical protein
MLISEFSANSFATYVNQSNRPSRKDIIVFYGKLCGVNIDFQNLPFHLDKLGI